MNNQQAEYEYIVVGSGAGGGTLAARLAQAGCKVLLIEAGGDPVKLQGGNAAYPDTNRLPEDYDVPVFHALSTENHAMKWDFWVRHYESDERQKKDPKYREEWNGEHVDGILYPRAGTLGGCTAHNAMIMVYPHNRDWDEIAELTDDPSWQADNMRKYFQRMENCRHRTFPPLRWIYNIFRWNPSRHGFRGWLTTEKALPKSALGDEDLVKTVARSAKVALKKVGHPWNRILWLFEGKGDPNDWRLVKEDAVGIRYPPLSTKRHARTGTREFLLEVQRKFSDNLTIELDALATKVLFDDRNNAIGIEYLKGARLYQAHYKPSTEPGEQRTVHASREVVLSGGAFNTPQLLMLSGIGPKAELEKHGIDVRVDLPGVGQNLQDRYEVGIVNRLKYDWEVLEDARFEPGDPQFAQWQKHRKGVYTSNGAVLAVIRRSHKSRPLPDLFCFALLGKFGGYEPDYSKALVDHKNYLTWAVLKAHTKNTAGTVTLDPRDPLNPKTRPLINFNYFEEGNDQHKEDLESVVDGVEFVRDMTSQISELIDEEEAPGQEKKSRADLRQFVEDNAWGHHASCTCKIGKSDDPMAVLDGNFRVHGTQGLRVVDASVFPRIPGFFIVSSVYMVAEKAADVILADAGRPPIFDGAGGRLKSIKKWLRKVVRWLLRPLAVLLAILALIVGFSWFVYEPLSKPKDEEQTIEDIIALFGPKMEAQYADQPQFLRDTHPKANACVRADFNVRPDVVEYLDRVAREEWIGHRGLGDDIGIFNEGGKTYKTWIRFSNAADVVTADSVKDFRGIAIKILGVEGQKLPVPSKVFLDREGAESDDDNEKYTQDFLFIAHDAFFAANPQHFLDFFEANVKGGGGSPRNPYVLWHFLTHPRGMINVMRGRNVFPSIADIAWFSAAPFKLGDAEVKYSALQCDAQQFHPPTADNTSEDYLAARLNDQLDPDWGGRICLSFNVQFRSHESQPIENTLIAWDPEDSPWHEVATIDIGPQEFGSPEQLEFCQNIAYNPWHSLPAHEPIGGINRARRDALFALQKIRLERNGRKRFEPTGYEIFYPGATFPWLMPPFESQQPEIETAASQTYNLLKQSIDPPNRVPTSARTSGDQEARD